jgi:hypothetical protein
VLCWVLLVRGFVQSIAKTVGEQGKTSQQFLPPLDVSRPGHGMPMDKIFWKVKQN